LDFRNLFEVGFLFIFMKLAVLFSGGKDSCYAMYQVSGEHDIVCLLSVFSENPESYMFHVPNIEWTKLQAEAMDLPILVENTKGEKEKELEDLKKLIVDAKEKFKIEGVVTGALASNYQASRIQKICDELDLKCLNPLWGMDQVQLLNELLDVGFETLIVGVFGYPLDEKWLGKKLNHALIEDLKKYSEKYQINPAGEGGEIETFVLDGPTFFREVVVEESEKEYENHAGVFLIKKAKLV
jgi:diphthine-ammonia ligase